MLSKKTIGAVGLATLVSIPFIREELPVSYAAEKKTPEKYEILFQDHIPNIRQVTSVIIQSEKTGKYQGRDTRINSQTEKLNTRFKEELKHITETVENNVYLTKNQKEKLLFDMQIIINQYIINLFTTITSPNSTDILQGFSAVRSVVKQTKETRNQLTELLEQAINDSDIWMFFSKNKDITDNEIEGIRQEIYKIFYSKNENRNALSIRATAKKRKKIPSLANQSFDYMECKRGESIANFDADSNLYPEKLTQNERFQIITNKPINKIVQHHNEKYIGVIDQNGYVSLMDTKNTCTKKQITIANNGRVTDQVVVPEKKKSRDVQRRNPQFTFTKEGRELLERLENWENIRLKEVKNCNMCARYVKDFYIRLYGASFAKKMQIRRDEGGDAWEMPRYLGDFMNEAINLRDFYTIERNKIVLDTKKSDEYKDAVNSFMHIAAAPESQKGIIYLLHKNSKQHRKIIRKLRDSKGRRTRTPSRVNIAQGANINSHVAMNNGVQTRTFRPLYQETVANAIIRDMKSMVGSSGNWNKNKSLLSHIKNVKINGDIVYWDKRKRDFLHRNGTNIRINTRRNNVITYDDVQLVEQRGCAPLTSPLTASMMKGQLTPVGIGAFNKRRIAVNIDSEETDIASIEDTEIDFNRYIRNAVEESEIIQNNGGEDLVHAIAENESQYGSMHFIVNNESGSLGVMQIIPSTAILTKPYSPYKRPYMNAYHELRKEYYAAEIRKNPTRNQKKKEKIQKAQDQKANKDLNIAIGTGGKKNNHLWKRYKKTLAPLREELLDEQKNIIAGTQIIEKGYYNLRRGRFERGKFETVFNSLSKKKRRMALAYTFHNGIKNEFKETFFRGLKQSKSPEAFEKFLVRQGREKGGEYIVKIEKTYSKRVSVVVAAK